MKWIFPMILCFAVSAGAAEHSYVGVKKCAMCHKGERNNMVYEKWQEAKHASAWTILASDRAQEVAAEMGVDGDPQQSGACLSCHTTGYGADASLTVKLSVEDGVSCEACHGAGGDYAKKPIMQDHAKSVAKGMIGDPSQICVECHKEELAHVGAFDYTERWAKITHSLPSE